MRIPNILYMRCHGTTAYVHIKGPESIKSKKLAPRAKKGRLVGYEGNNGHIYRVWIPTENKIVQSRDMTFNEAPDLPIATLEDELTVWEPEPELPPEPQGSTTTVVTTITYPTAKAPEEKEHHEEEPEGLYTPDSVLGEQGPRGATPQLPPSPEPAPSTQSNRSPSRSSSLEAEDSPVPRKIVMASKKAIDLHRDMRRYATTFQMTNASTAEEADRALRAFEKTA